MFQQLTRLLSGDREVPTIQPRLLPTQIAGLIHDHAPCLEYLRFFNDTDGYEVELALQSGRRESWPSNSSI